ncbi:MAG: pimeloyl-ACP methyl ester carboxylesterase, partial [Rhodococcus sp. (in: high G+C Gram-positive bacteria)]
EKLRTIAGVGHYAHQEAPERVNRELGDFLLTEK